MSRFLTLGGLSRIWDNIKGRLMPEVEECQHTNISGIVATKWCTSRDITNSTREDDTQHIYICKNCGKIKPLDSSSGTTGSWGCDDDEPDLWSPNIGKWVDPHIFVSHPENDSLYHLHYPYTAIQEFGNIDYIIETGTINGWTYQKWNSGFLELWINYYETGGSFSAGMTNKVVLIATENDNFPFLSPKQCFVTGGLSGHYSSHTEYANIDFKKNLSYFSSNNSEDIYLDIWFYAGSNYTSNYWIRAYCTGRWKEES